MHADTAPARPVVPLTVAISTLDRPEALARCLRSLLEGSALPTEVVVVDQSDDRRAGKVVEAVEDGLAILYVRDAGRGLGRSQNIAVSRAKNDRVAVIDDDCVADARWLATMWRTLDEVDVAAGRVLPLGPDVAGLYPVATRTSAVRRAVDGTTLPWQVGSGNNFGFARAWYERVGGCDERLGPGSPGRGAVDLDLFYRLVRAGARVRYEPDAVVFHERAPRRERLARRIPYGYGMGACCTLWLRGGDAGGLRVLVAWLRFRSSRLRRAIADRRWLGAYEEALVLAGTVRGIGYGLRVRSPSPKAAVEESR
ncbi:MAG: glycosyltransferase [Thermoleophilia bacterium]|nr:glycosyltransferase [Thermoleophilia bacterium]